MSEDNPERGEGVGAGGLAQGVGGLRGRVDGRCQSGDEDRDQNARGLGRGTGGVQLGAGGIETGLVRVGQAQFLADEPALRWVASAEASAVTASSA